MKPTQIIGSKPKVPRNIPNLVFVQREEHKAGHYLEVAEFYCDTIQGEGATIGQSAAFLRLQGCLLNCKWCDTREVWKHGNPYGFSELLQLMDQVHLPTKLKEGQHLVITGGSPLMQQEALIKFINMFIDTYDFWPVVEVENECVIMPENQMVEFTEVWNNSPKLSNSGNAYYQRYKPEVIKFMGELHNSWFKFVVSDSNDWAEIQNDFLNKELIKREQIILMPRGETQTKLYENRMITINMAIKHNVRYCTREHIVLWNTSTGV